MRKLRHRQSVGRHTKRPAESEVCILVTDTGVQKNAPPVQRTIPLCHLHPNVSLERQRSPDSAPPCSLSTIILVPPPNRYLLGHHVITDGCSTGLLNAPLSHCDQVKAVVTYEECCRASSCFNEIQVTSWVVEIFFPIAYMTWGYRSSSSTEARE